MTDLEPILAHAAPFLMVLFRLSGLMLFAPVLSSSIIPARIRILLVFMLAAAMYPSLPAHAIVPELAGPLRMDLFSIAPAIFAETLIGAAIGLLASIPLFAAQMAGIVIGQQTGITLGAVFNPALDTEGDAISQLLTSIALAAFLAFGGLEAMWLSLASTFSRVPLGHVGLTLAPIDLLLGLSSAGFELALRVSAPLVCILLIETVASSIITKTMPQLNILSIGYGVKVVLGIGVLAAGVAVIEQSLSLDVRHAMEQIVGWTQSLGVQNSNLAPLAPIK